MAKTTPATLALDKAGVAYDKDAANKIREANA